MDAFGFSTPTYGAPSSGLGDLLRLLGKEDVVEGDATEPAGEYYRKTQEKKLGDLFGDIDPSYLKTLGNGGGGATFGLPATGTPNIPRILDAVPLEYLIPMLGLTGIGGRKQG